MTTSLRIDTLCIYIANSHLGSVLSIIYSRSVELRFEQVFKFCKDLEDDSVYIKININIFNVVVFIRGITNTTLIHSTINKL